MEIAAAACRRIGYEPVFREIALDERFARLAAGKLLTTSAADPIVPAALKAASKTAFEEEGVAEPHPLLHHAGIL